MPPTQQLESLWCASKDAKPHLLAINLEINPVGGHKTTELMEVMLQELGAHYLTRYPSGENCDIVMGHCRILPQHADSALNLVSNHLSRAGIFPIAFRINALNS